MIIVKIQRIQQFIQKKIVIKCMKVFIIHNMNIEIIKVKFLIKMNQLELMIRIFLIKIFMIKVNNNFQILIPNKKL